METYSATPDRDVAGTGGSGSGTGVGAGAGRAGDRVPGQALGPGRAGSRAPVTVVLIGAFGAFLGFSLVFPIVPEYAAHGGAGELGAGLATAVFILATVLVQPAAARMLTTAGHRAALLTGVILLGPPTILPLLSDRLAVIDLSSLLRGAGFGIFVVAGVATILDLPSPRAGRGRNLGRYAAITGAAGILGTPAGTWLVPRAGYPTVFAVATVAPLILLVGAHTIRLPRPPRPAHRPRAGAQRRGHGPDRRGRLPAALADPALRRLFTIELASTVGYGVAFTFLPLAAPPHPAWAVPAAFLVQQTTATTARWVTGTWADHHDTRRLLRPAATLAALGLSSCAYPQDPVLLLAGMALFGAGFGALQNATLMAMLDQTDTPTASVAWNLAFDSGTGLGAAGGALVLQAAGPVVTFLATAGTMVVSALPRLRIAAARR
ncbi:MAG TPA: MFS transporter [Actinocrinis sp.]|nr:MFS transporter [Actinocrinis sp.]